MSLLTAASLAVDAGGRRVLHDVDFTIEPSEIVTVVGPNGAGKSTFVRALIGALRPSGGRLRRMRGLKIGYVPQRLAVDATMPMTVERFLNLPRRRPRKDVADALARVGADGLERQQMATLSGGQLQRVLLARALADRPHLLVLDEPTQSLDQPAIAAFYRLLADVRHDLGCAVLLVSHDLNVVMGASDRVICLNGHICCQGTPTFVTAAPEYRALFGRDAFALYEHHHDHVHDPSNGHDHGHGHDHHNDDGAAA